MATNYYGTPTYDFNLESSNVNKNAALQQVAQDYGRFLGQERFRRQNEDFGRQFRNTFPTVGRRFNRRNMYDSGLRREAQQKMAEAFQRQGDRSRFDFGAAESGYEIADQLREAGLESAINDLASSMYKRRATTFDPYQGVRSY